MDLLIPLKIYSSIVYPIKLPEKVLKLSQFSRQIPFLAVKNIIIYLLQKSSEILQIYYKDPHSRDSLRVLRLRWIELFVPRPSCLGVFSQYGLLFMRNVEVEGLIPSGIFSQYFISLLFFSSTLNYLQVLREIVSFFLRRFQVHTY